MIDCQSFEVLAQGIWDCWPPKQKNSMKPQSTAWGFLICRSPDDTIYGALGTVSGTAMRCETGYGIVLPVDADSINSVPLLDQFALACGLSITARAGLELGDALVVAGMNSLAHYVLAAGRAQGASTLRLTHYDSKQLDNDNVISLDAAAMFDERLTTFLAGVTGNVVFVDTCGDVALIHAMVANLARFGRLILCRPDVSDSAVLNIRDFQHRRSAVFDYWAGPVTLEDAAALQRHFELAGRLIKWRQMPAFEYPNSQLIEMVLDGV